MRWQGKIVLALIGVGIGIVWAIMLTRRGAVGGAVGGTSTRGGPTATMPTGAAPITSRSAGAASASMPGPSLTTASGPASAPASQPPPVRAVRVGDQVIGLEQRMTRVVTPHAVYVTYENARNVWQWKEGGEGASVRAVGAGDPAIGEAAVRAALAEPGASAVDPGAIAWPLVGAMKLVDPAGILRDRFPAQNGPVTRDVGELVVGVNALAQAEDGTFFAVCSERRKAAGDDAPLPPFEVRASAGQPGFSVGRIAQIEAGGIRVEMVIIVPRDQLKTFKRVAFEMTTTPAGGAAPQAVEVDVKAQGPDVSLQDAARQVYAFCETLDGAAEVRASAWRLNAGRLDETQHRLGEWTEDEFVGQVLRHIADRREVLAPHKPGA